MRDSAAVPQGAGLLNVSDLLRRASCQVSRGWGNKGPTACLHAPQPQNQELTSTYAQTELTRKDRLGDRSGKRRHHKSLRPTNYRLRFMRGLSRGSA